MSNGYHLSQKGFYLKGSENGMHSSDLTWTLLIINSVHHFCFFNAELVKLITQTKMKIYPESRSLESSNKLCSICGIQHRIMNEHIIDFNFQTIQSCWSKCYMDISKFVLIDISKWIIFILQNMWGTEAIVQWLESLLCTWPDLSSIPDIWPSSFFCSYLWAQYQEHNLTQKHLKKRKGNVEIVNVFNQGKIRYESLITNDSPFLSVVIFAVRTGN